MPRKSKRVKLMDLVIADFEFIAATTSGEKLDGEIDNFVEDVEEIILTRYFAPRLYLPKSNDWFTTILPNLDDDRFRRALRVTRDQFLTLTELLSQDEVFHSSTNPQLNFDMQLAVALYRFGHNGNGSSYMNVAAKFGIGDGGTVHKITQRVIQAILKLKPKYVHWPGPEERLQLGATVDGILPGCIGFLDGTHVNLNVKPSVMHPDDYFSRKHRYGLHLQVVCDVDLKIRQYSVGRTARTHDAYMYNESKLASHPNQFFSAEEYLATDAAYKLTSTVITPFRKTRQCDVDWAKERQFNKEFSSLRVKVEHCYGILKQKFRSLQDLRVAIVDNKSHEFSCHWIEACIILHNILLTPEDVDDFDVNSEEIETFYDRPYDLEDSEAGEFRRNQLLNLITN